MLLFMCTTLTLDDDVAAALDSLRKSRRNASLRDLGNEALRAGLQQMTGRATIRTRAVSLGHCRVGNVDNVAEVLPASGGGLGD